MQAFVVSPGQTTAMFFPIPAVPAEIWRFSPSPKESRSSSETEPQAMAAMVRRARFRCTREERRKSCDDRGPGARRPPQSFIATTGSRRAASRAGNQPASSPMTPEQAAVSARHGGGELGLAHVLVCRGKTAQIPAGHQPSRSRRRRRGQDRSPAGTGRGRARACAPSAILMPISRVRSSTDDVHDVRDADPADDQRQAADDPQEAAEGEHEGVEELGTARSCPRSPALPCPWDRSGGGAPGSRDTWSLSRLGAGGRARLEDEVVDVLAPVRARKVVAGMNALSLSRPE